MGHIVHREYILFRSSNVSCSLAGCRPTVSIPDTGRKKTKLASGAKIVMLSPRSHLHVAGMLRFMSLTQPTELANSSFILFLCLFLSLWSFQLYFHSINSPDDSSLSHSVLPVLFLPYWSFQLWIFLRSVS